MRNSRNFNGRWMISMIALFVCVLALASSARAADKIIRITMARSVSCMPLWGIGPFAEKYGLHIEFIASANNAEMQRNLQNGIEVGSLGFHNAAMMAEQNVTNVKIIAGIQSGGQNLIVRKGVELNSWKDLEGKRIGQPPGSYASILFILAARENGVDLSKVNFINTTPAGPAELQALKNGDLDGLVLWSPVIDRAVVDGYAYYPPCCDIGSTKAFGGGNQVLAANTDFLKDRATVLKFLKAYAESQEYYLKNPDKAVDFISQYTGASKDVLNEAWKHGSWDLRFNLQNMINVAKEGPKFGFTKSDMSDKVPQYIDMSFLSESIGRP